MLAYAFLGPDGFLSTSRFILKVKGKYLKAAMSKVCPWVPQQVSGLMDGMVIEKL